jgi:hypothetical protein
MYKIISNIGDNMVDDSCGPAGPITKEYGYGYEYSIKPIYTDRKGYTGHNGHNGYNGHTGSNRNMSGYTGHTGPNKNVTGHTGPSQIHQIQGSLGVYNGCEEMPYNKGHLYNLKSSYKVMEERPKSDRSIHFINQLGLQAMEDYVMKDMTSGENKKGYYYVYDGRVVDAPRSIRMTLDQPAMVGAVDMDQVAYFDNSNYGGTYKTYSDIKNGQIAYYVNQDISQPFFNPVYTLSSFVDKTIRVDPMDSPKPEYIKTPITSTFHSVSKDQATRDELSFREDLMSRQQNLYNRTSWTNRWISDSPFQ